MVKITSDGSTTVKAALCTGFSLLELCLAVRKRVRRNDRKHSSKKVSHMTRFQLTPLNPLPNNELLKKIKRQLHRPARSKSRYLAARGMAPDRDIEVGAPNAGAPEPVYFRRTYMGDPE